MAFGSVCSPEKAASAPFSAFLSKGLTSASAASVASFNPKLISTARTSSGWTASPSWRLSRLGPPSPTAVSRRTRSTRPDSASSPAPVSAASRKSKSNTCASSRKAPQRSPPSRFPSSWSTRRVEAFRSCWAPRGPTPRSPRPAPRRPMPSATPFMRFGATMPTSWSPAAPKPP